MTKKNIVILAVITVVAAAAIVLFVRVPMTALMLGMLSTALLTMFFTVLALLPISDIFFLTFVGFSLLAVWAFYKRDLKPVLFPGLALVLPVLAAAILMKFFPKLEWYFTYHLLLPFSAIMLSMFTGLGAIVMSSSCRQNVRQVLRLVVFTCGALILSIFFQFALLLLWALQLMPYLTNIITISVIAFLYWPSPKRGLFPKVLGAVLVLESLLLLTLQLITL